MAAVVCEREKHDLVHKELSGKSREMVHDTLIYRAAHGEKVKGMWPIMQIREEAAKKGIYVRNS